MKMSLLCQMVHANALIQPPRNVLFLTKGICLHKVTIQGNICQFDMT
jgi:hypothetical protein